MTTKPSELNSTYLTVGSTWDNSTLTLDELAKQYAKILLEDEKYYRLIKEFMRGKRLCPLLLKMYGRVFKKAFYLELDLPVPKFKLPEDYSFYTYYPIICGKGALDGHGS